LKISIQKNAKIFGNEFLFIYFCHVKVKDTSKEDLIIRATLRLVYKEGLAGLKMSDIAKEANMAVGTLYIYFKHKEELLNEIFLRCKRESMQKLAQKIDFRLPFRLNFKQLWQNYLNFALESPEQATLLEQLHRSPYLRPAAIEEADNLLNPIREMLNEGKKQMLIKNTDNELLLAFLSGSINQIARLCAETNQTLTLEQCEQAFEMAWDAVSI
jgi:TetR/AcrR family transcriptional regulator, repressor of fatR-cypB operon